MQYISYTVTGQSAWKSESSCIADLLCVSQQTRPNILSDLVFACWKLTRDLCVSLLFVQIEYRYIPICNTEYIYKTKCALLNQSRTSMYTLVWDVHVCIKVIQIVQLSSAPLDQSIELQISGLWVWVQLWARIFQYVFCRFRCASCRSTGPIQMKSSMTFIRGVWVHRDNDHLKELNIFLWNMDAPGGNKVKIWQNL